MFNQIIKFVQLASHIELFVIDFRIKSSLIKMSTANENGIKKVA